MENTTNSANEDLILIEFTHIPGVKQTSLSLNDLKMKSREAMNNAMTIVKNMANNITKTIESISDRPSSVEVSFGIKFDLKTGAIIAQSGIESNLNIKLIWNHK